jgi:hypothetical protein
MKSLFWVRMGRFFSLILAFSISYLANVEAQVMLARYASTNTISPASVASNVISSNITLGNYVSPGSPCGSGLSNRVVTVGTESTLSFTVTPAPGYKLDLAYNKAAVRSTSSGNVNAPTFAYTISSGGGSGTGTGTSPTTASCLSSAGANTQGDWNYADFTVNPGYSVVFSYGFTGATSTAGNTQVHTLEVYGTVTCAATLSNNLVGSSQTISVNTTPAVLTGNLPTVSGIGAYGYQWQSSTDNSTFTNISGATNQNYQPGVTSANIYFRRIASYNECAINTSGSISIATTTNPCYLPIGNNLIGSNQTISQGSSPLSFTGSIPIGATQVYTYAWEQSSDNSSWSAISGATLQGYSHGILSQNTYFRRIVYSDICTPHTSGLISITALSACVNPLGNNTIGADQTISINTTPALFTGSIPSGGQNGYSYQWEQSTNQSTWSAISGATAQDYQAGNILQQTWFRRIVSDLPCVAVTSSPISVEVICNVPIGNNQIGNAQTLVVGNSASALTGSTPSGGSGIYTYQWESSGNNSTWASIVGATDATFAPGTPNQTLWLRRVVSGTLCSSVNSNELMIAVVCGNPIGNNNIGASQTMVAGDSPSGLTGTIATGGPGGISYQWLQSLNQINWSAISGATSQNYQPGSLTQTTWFRRLALAISPCIPDSSMIVEVTVLPNNSVVLARYCVTQNQLSPSYVLPGGLLSAGNISLGGSFTLNTGGPCAQGVSLTNSSTANGTLTFSLTPTSGYQIRMSEVICGGRRSTNGGSNLVVSYSISSGGGSASSSSLNVPTVSCISSQNNAFNWNFTNTIVPDGRTVTFTKTFSSFAGSGGATQVFSCEVLGTVECVSVITGNTISVAQTINYNNTPALLSGSIPGGGPGSIAYAWQESGNNSSWSTISSGSTRDFQPGALTQNTYYRRIASYNICSADTTPSQAILVIQNVCISPLGNNTISGTQTILSGTTPTLFNGSTPTGGTGIFNFVWEQSTDNSSWTAISGATDANHQYGVVSQNLYYRRIVSASPCTPSTSNVISVEAEPCSNAISGNTLFSNQTIASGTAPALVTGNFPSGSPGYYQFAWESSSDNSSWNLITGSTTQNYQAGIAYADVWYRRIVLAPPCASDTSASVQIAVACGNSIGNNIISGNQTISGGDLPALLSGSSPSGGSGIYTYQWEGSNDHSNWTPIIGATSINYLPVNLTQSVWLRRTVNSFPCPTDNSNEVYLTVFPDTSVVLVRYAVTSGQLIPAYTLPGGNFSVSNLSVGGIFALSGSPCATGLTLTNGTTTVGTGTLNFTLTASSGYVLNLSQILSGIRRSSQGAQNCQISYSISGGGATGTSSILPTVSSGCQTISNTQGNWNFTNFTVPQGRTISFTLTFSTFGGNNASTQLHTLELFGNVACEAVIGAGVISANQTILTGTSPAMISGNSPSGGPGVLQYQWQNSSDQSNWSFIGGGTDINIQPGVLSQSTYYRRVSSFSVCASNTSNEILVTVFTAPGNNTISSDQTVCSTSVSGTLSGSIPTGGNGSYSYQWESSTDNSIWSAIANATDQHFTPTTPSGLTFYRRQATAYFSSFSNSVSITPIPLLTQNTLTGTQTICAGINPSSLTGSLPSGGDGSFNYLWESSSDNSAWTTISAASTQNYSPGMPSSNAYYRRIVSAGYCPAITSSSVSILRYDAIGSNSIGTNQTLCAAGIPQNLTGSSPSGGIGLYSYLWQTSLNNSTWGNHPGTNQNLTTSYLSATTYYRRVVSSSICPADTSLTTTIILLVGQNDIASSQTIPYNSAPAAIIGLTNINMPGYAWEQSHNNFHWIAIPGGNASVYNPSTLIQHMWYRRKVAGPGCDTITSAPVKITLTMVTDTALTASSISPVCSGSPVYLNAQGPSNATYIWYGPNGYSSTLQNPSFVSSTESLSGIYRVRCTKLNGDTASVTVNVEVGSSLGNFQVVYNNPICVGSTLLLSSSHLPRVGYTWSGPNGFTSNAAVNSFANAQTTLNGIYTISATSPGCQSITRNISVIVNAPLNPMPGSNGPVCEANVLRLTSNSRLGATYLWTGPSGFSSTLANPTISSVQTLNSGIYTLTMGGLGCSSVTQIHAVVVNATIGNLSISSNSPLCLGNTLTLSIPSYVNATYNWSGPNGFTTAGSNVLTRANGQVNFSGVYTLVTVVPGCGSATRTRSVTVFPSFAATVGSNGPICIGSVLTLTTTPVAGASYTWTGPNGFSSTMQNPTISNAQSNRSGVYALTLSLPGCGTASYVTTVQVNASPNNAIILGNSPVCGGNAINLTANAITNASYSWSGPSAFTANTHSISRSSAQLSHAGIYTVTIVVPGCGTSIKTYKVVVFESGNVVASVGPGVCASAPMYLYASSILGASYSWSGPNGFTSSLQNPTFSNAQPNQSGIYSVTATQGTCGTSSSTVNVLVSMRPSSAQVSAAQTICTPGALTLTGTDVAGATLSWAGPSGFTASGSTFTIASTTLANGGTYTYTVATSGCGTAPRFVNVTALSGSQVTGTVYPNPICTGAPLYLQSGFINGATYNWSGPSGFNVNTQNSSRNQVTTLMGGVYTLTVNLPVCGAFTQNYTLVVNTCRNASEEAEAIEEVAVVQELKSFNLEVYPNPTEGITTVTLTGLQTEDSELAVFDLLGHQVLVSGKVTSNIGSKSWALDFRGIAKGVYFVKLNTEAGEKVERIVVR